MYFEQPMSNENKRTKQQPDKMQDKKKNTKTWFRHKRRTGKEMLGNRRHAVTILHGDRLMLALILSSLKLQHCCVLLLFMLLVFQRLARSLARAHVNVDGSVVHGLVGTAAWRAAVKHLAVLALPIRSAIMRAAVAAAVCPDVLLAHPAQRMPSKPGWCCQPS